MAITPVLVDFFRYFGVDPCKMDCNPFWKIPQGQTWGKSPKILKVDVD